MLFRYFVYLVFKEDNFFKLGIFKMVIVLFGIIFVCKLEENFFSCILFVFFFFKEKFSLKDKIFFLLLMIGKLVFGENLNVGIFFFFI